MAGALKPVTDSTFEWEVIQAGIPAVVMFWAPWCQFSRTMLPVLEEMASEYAGKVRFATVDIDDVPLTPERYRVDKTPSFYFIKDGEVLGQLVGDVPKAKLVESLGKLLS